MVPSFVCIGGALGNLKVLLKLSNFKGTENQHDNLFL